MHFPKHTPRAASRRSGYTLIETILASALFSGIGYVLVLSMQASEQSHQTVTQNVASNDRLREVSESLRNELRAARRSSIVLDAPAGANSSIQFQTALNTNGGMPTWGVFDRRIDPDETLCRQVGWSLRYAVEQNNAVPNQLVRRVLDENGVTQLIHVMAQDVTSFTIDGTGDVWNVRLETLGSEGMREDEFDVLIRNN